jgi:hypothetical protein
MMRGVAAAVLLFLSPLLVHAQRGRRPTTSITAPPLKGVVISFHGTLKELSKKTILLQTEDNQLVTLRRSSKTKFVNHDGPIRADDVDADDTVTIDATEDNDLKLLATSVRLDAPAPRKDPALVPRSK